VTPLKPLLGIAARDLQEPYDAADAEDGGTGLGLEAAKVVVVLHRSVCPLPRLARPL
jgi:hypothetical protein